MSPYLDHPLPWDETLPDESEYPACLVFEIDDYERHLAALQARLQAPLEATALLAQTLACLRCEGDAELSLEYLYLGLADELIQFGASEPGSEEVLNFMQDTALLVLQEFLFHKVYRNGILPYAFYRREQNRFIFKRWDRLKAEVARDLETPGAQSRHSQVRYLRYVQHYCGVSPSLQPQRA